MDHDRMLRIREIVASARAAGTIIPSEKDQLMPDIPQKLSSPPPVKERRPPRPITSCAFIREVEKCPTYLTLDELLAAYPPDKGKVPSNRLRNLIQALPSEAFAIFQRLMSHQRCMNPILHWTASSVERVVVMLDAPDRYEPIRIAVEHLRTGSYSLAHSGTSQQFWMRAARRGAHHSSKPI